MSAPLTEAENEFLLGVYRSAVDYYQPRIEKRTGVLLGKIRVWDHRQLDQHMMCNLERRLGFLDRFVLRRRLRKISQNLKSRYAERAQHCPAFYYRSAIYVSFSVDVRCHEEGLAVTAVHELSHGLWERLEGKPLDEIRSCRKAKQEKFELLIEGYATYAQHVWFSDLYPECVKRMLPHWGWDRASIHFRGLRRIQELVEQFGPQILLKIPKRWRRL
jgi:hypothetical protein